MPVFELPIRPAVANHTHRPDRDNDEDAITTATTTATSTTATAATTTGIKDDLRDPLVWRPDRTRLENRAYWLAVGHLKSGGMVKVLEEILWYRRRERIPSFWFQSQKINLYSSPCKSPYPAPAAFYLPSSPPKVGLLCIDYESISFMRRQGTERAWWKLKRDDNSVIAVRHCFIVDARPKTVEDELEDPFIVAMLVAVAQARRPLGGDSLVSQVLLSHGNTYVHLYTAAIPRKLLRWLDKSKAAISPPNPGAAPLFKPARNWPDVKIGRLDIPFWSYDDFHTRLGGAIPSERAKLGESVDTRLSA